MARKDKDRTRFAVGTSPDDVRSSFWYINAYKSDVYLGARSLGGTLKVSFHGDRNSHVKFGPSSSLGSLANSYVTKWKRPEIRANSIAQVASVYFPTDFLRGKMTRPKGDAQHILFEPAPVGFAVELMLFYTHLSPEDVERELKNVCTPIQWSKLDNGEVSVVAARHKIFDTANIPQLNNLKDGTPIVSPGTTWVSPTMEPGEKKSNVAMLLFNDPAKTNFLEIIQVSGVNLTRNTPQATITT